MSACLKAHSRVSRKRDCACSTSTSAPDSARSTSLDDGTPSAVRPPSHPTRPNTLSFAAASRAESSRASRWTWMAASIVGAAVASCPLAARRASSSAKSGEPAACCAIVSVRASPASPVAWSPSIALAMARTVFFESGRSSIFT
jgi:hypothetical protein